jgi:HPt (histidine-containing phosphotransfer) domain-containing protein
MEIFNFEFLKEQFDDDMVCIRDILDIFLESSDSTVFSLSRALTSKDEYGLANYSHKLKGSSGMIGGEALAAMCLDVDMLCKEKKCPEAFKKAVGIENCYYELKDVIQSVLDDLN